MKQESCQEKGLPLKIEQVSKSPAKKNHHAGPFLINLFFFPTYAMEQSLLYCFFTIRNAVLH